MNSNWSKINVESYYIDTGTDRYLLRNKIYLGLDSGVLFGLYLTSYLRNQRSLYAFALFCTDA